MSKAKKGDQVQIHYTGTLDNGDVFDSSQGRDPLAFILGTGQVIPGFDQAVDGMAIGEKKSIHIPCEQAYGPKRNDLVLKVGKDQFPPNIDPAVGQQLQMQTQTGQPVMVTVTEVGGQEVTLDANHPLAGQDLNFDLELMGIN